MRNCLFSILLCLPCLAVAQNTVDRLVLKDGSQYEGYIKIQHIGTDFVFVSEKATVIVKDATISQNSIDIEKLPEQWKEWAKKHKNSINQEDNTFSLSTIFFNIAKERELKDVYVLEEGDEIKYIDLQERTDTILLKDIQLIERILVPDSVLSKTIDVITRKNGNKEEIVKGQIISQVPGEKTKIKLKSGAIKVIKFSDIISESKEKVCSDLSFCEQSRYLEIVRTTSKEEIAGVITMRYYGDNSDESYLMVTDRDDQPHKVLMKDVKEIQKTINKDYKERILFVAKGDDVYVNRNLARWHQSEKNTSLKKMAVKADSGIVKIPLTNGSNEVDVEVEMQNTEENRAMFLLNLKAEVKSKDLFYTFSLESVADEMITPQKESVNSKETLSRTYTLHKGKYVLYRRSDKKCVLLFIE